MNVHPFIATGLIATHSIICISLPTLAQNIKSISGCNTALRLAKNQIQNNRKVKVVNIYQSNIAENYKLYPKNRPHSYAFGLEGAATESILISGRFLTSITENIISNCPSVSMVSFGLNHSDYVVTYGLLKANRIKFFECINDYSNKSLTQKLPWGFVFCI
ncbi:hypothetical protein [Umezakia ovalisporum]|jgi:hypothetical protein|uniref:hypothetical protein n=1 Tax=Umezakia ovalisporum TaxID=75695 RepID=UPI002475DA72|nr:hypothetical protein [Umezakia ovalisporum]MDH6066672.1 hypothetical protein [Umezakia ovalisporum APH033B]MDH6088328.1 hypothetical protein [Umezakia ovalisporum Ak1311]MDH6101885.1 hypothetical protein [Umezakia ovalisporum ANA283AFssAo]